MRKLLFINNFFLSLEKLIIIEATKIHVEIYIIYIRNIGTWDRAVLSALRAAAPPSFNS